MDREIQPNVRRKKLMWQGLVILLVTGALTLVGWSSAGLLKPTLSRDRVRTAKAELGPIEATISAAGKVVPEFEQVLSAPVQTRVLKILKRPGDVLRVDSPGSDLEVWRALAGPAVERGQRAQHQPPAAASRSNRHLPTVRRRATMDHRLSTALQRLRWLLAHGFGVPAPCASAGGGACSWTPSCGCAPAFLRDGA